MPAVPLPGIEQLWAELLDPGPSSRGYVYVSGFPTLPPLKSGRLRKRTWSSLGPAHPLQTIGSAAALFQVGVAPSRTTQPSLNYLTSGSHLSNRRGGGSGACLCSLPLGTWAGGFLRRLCSWRERRVCNLEVLASVLLVKTQVLEAVLCFWSLPIHLKPAGGREEHRGVRSQAQPKETQCSINCGPLLTARTVSGGH